MQTEDVLFYVSGVNTKNMTRTVLWKNVREAIIRSFKSREFDLVVHPETHVVTVVVPSYLARRLASCNVMLDGKLLGFSTESGSLSRAARVYRDPLPLPVFDPDAEKKRKTRENALRHNIRIVEVQLGVHLPPSEDREPNFSMEWNTKQDAYMSFDDKERDVIIEIGGHQDPLYKRICIPMSSIESISNGFYYDPFVLMDLRWPPTFMEQYWHQKLGKLIWARKAYFDDNHKRICNYASQSIRIVLANDYDHLSDFMSMSKFTKLPQLRQSFLQEVLSQGVYSRDALQQLAQWVEAIPWSVAFQLETLRYNRLLIPSEILALQHDVMLMIDRHGVEKTSDCLRQFAVAMKRENIRHMKEQEQYEYRGSVHLFKLAAKEHKESYDAETQQKVKFPCRHITFTPTSVQLEGPFPDQGNRILRQFPGHMDHFLRVHFSDEGLRRYKFRPEVDNESFIDENVGGILYHGFTLAGRRFEFLGYSSSALKEHSCWFFAPFTDEKTGIFHDGDSIRASLGDFSSESLRRNPAKLAARIGQALSATDPSVRVSHDEVEWIDDIESPFRATPNNDPAVYTDGCGTISPDLAHEIWQELLRSRVARPNEDAALIAPKVFQIRFGPAKGMVSVDYRLKGRRICIRQSMKKFGLHPDAVESEIGIEIAMVFTRPSPMFLNQPMITLLETLGVKSQVLLRLLAAATEDTEEILKGPIGSAQAMLKHALGRSSHLPTLFNLLDKYGLGSLCSDDLTLYKVRNYIFYHILRDIKHKARIRVPDAYTLVGVADVHGILNEGEVHICIHEAGKEPVFLEGRFLITRSPMMHPGDIQIATAIGKPIHGSPYDIEHLPNCVVFPCKGARPLPNCLGGGDLDGDLYNLVDLSKNPGLDPPTIDEPASYAGPKPLKINHDATYKDIADFYTRYLTADSLGLISVRHRVAADQARLGARDKECLKLSQQHSDAVDYPKTGKPVRYRDIFKAPLTPDWFAGELYDSRNGDYYRSERALGQLYRNVTLDEARDNCLTIKLQPRAPSAAQNREVIESSLKPRIEALLGKNTFTSLTDGQMMRLLQMYSTQLAYIRATHALAEDPDHVLTEEEVFVGTIFAKSSDPSRRQDLMSRMRELMKDLVDNIRWRLSGHEERDRKTLKEGQAFIWLAQSWRAFQIAKDSEFGIGEVIYAEPLLVEPQVNDGPVPSIPLPKLGYLTPSLLQAAHMQSESVPVVMSINNGGRSKTKKKGNSTTISIGPAKPIVNGGKAPSTPPVPRPSPKPELKSTTSAPSPKPPFNQSPASQANPPRSKSAIPTPQNPYKLGGKSAWSTAPSPNKNGHIETSDPRVPIEGAKTFAWIALTSALEAMEFLEARNNKT